jgi:ATP-binding cassette subfamily F protein uup
LAEPAKAKAPRKEAVERPKTARAAKLNFSDAHALKVLPDRIAATQNEIAALEERLSDPGLYAKDPGLFAELSGTLAGLQARKDADEERWLALELLREDLEKG